ncbi:hypothetical protein DD563_13165 [Pelagicola sp. LXJ1103]|nr:hypothetical protein DD563_13165 [Pelagicola sp. LXJ1103]
MATACANWQNSSIIALKRPRWPKGRQRDAVLHLAASVQFRLAFEGLSLKGGNRKFAAFTNVDFVASTADFQLSSI